MSILSQVIMVVLDFVINLFTQWVSLSLGLWTMVLVDMTIDSLKEPDVARNLCCLPIQIKARYYPYVFLLIFGLLFPPGFFALLAGYTVGVLYSYGYLKFTEPSDNLLSKVHGLIFRHFENHEAYVSNAAALGDDGAGVNGGLPMFVRQPQQPMPPPGQPRGDSGATSQPVTPFSGKGVSVGTAVTGYQGNNNTYANQQNIREPPKSTGPNPNIQNSKLIKEHQSKQQENNEDDEDEDKKIDSMNSGDSQDLI